MTEGPGLLEAVARSGLLAVSHAIEVAFGLSDVEDAGAVRAMCGPGDKVYSAVGSFELTADPATSRSTVIRWRSSSPGQLESPEPAGPLRSRLSSRSYMPDTREVTMPRSRAARALTLNQMDDLLDYLEGCLDGRECDGSMSHIEAFLGGGGMDVTRTLEWLRDCGAWCDCEVWMNVR